MSISLVLVGLGERDGDDAALGLAARLVDPDGAIVPVHVPPPHRWGGSRAAGLARAAEQQGADLVVLGSGRRAAPGRTAPTRTAMQLLEQRARPVAVAPRDHDASGPFRHIGIAHDGTPEADAALAVAYALAGRDHAAVTLFRAVQEHGLTYAEAGVGSRELDLAAQHERVAAQETLDAAAERAPAGVNPETVLLHGHPAPDIAAAADGIIDLLVTGSRGLGPVRRALGASVTEQLLPATTMPVLVVPGAATD